MDSSYLERLAAEELLFQNFSLVGTGYVLASGSLKAGYAVNVNAGADLVPAGGGSEGTPTGACCNAGSCSQTTYGDCIDSGGIWQGLFVPCAAGMCGSGGGGGDHSGACCEDTDCHIYTLIGCNNVGGTYQGNNTTCDPNPCGAEPTGACCSPFDGSCSVQTAADCASAGGVYRGDSTTCGMDTRCADCFTSTMGAPPCTGCVTNCGSPPEIPPSCVDIGSAYGCCVINGICIQDNIACGVCGAWNPIDGSFCWCIPSEYGQCYFDHPDHGDCPGCCINTVNCPDGCS